MNKKTLCKLLITTFILNSFTINVFALTPTSLPKLKPLEKPKLSNNYNDLKKNINNEGNLTDCPKLPNLPEMDLKEFDEMTENYKTKKDEFREEGFEKKNELPTPTLPTVDKDSIINKFENTYKQKSSNLKAQDVSSKQIKDELKKFDNNITAQLNKSTSSNNKSTNTHKGGGTVNSSPKMRGLLTQKFSLNYGSSSPIRRSTGGGGSSSSNSSTPTFNNNVANKEFDRIFNNYKYNKDHTGLNAVKNWKTSKTAKSVTNYIEKNATNRFKKIEKERSKYKCFNKKGRFTGYGLTR